MSSSSGACSAGISYVTVFHALFCPSPFRPVLYDNPYYVLACISTAPPNLQHFQNRILIYVRKRRCHNSDAAAKDLIYETRSLCLILLEEYSSIFIPAFRGEIITLFCLPNGKAMRLPVPGLLMPNALTLSYWPYTRKYNLLLKSLARPIRQRSAGWADPNVRQKERETGRGERQKATGKSFIR